MPLIQQNSIHPPLPDPIFSQQQTSTTHLQDPSLYQSQSINLTSTGIPPQTNFSQQTQQIIPEMHSTEKDNLESSPFK